VTLCRLERQRSSHLILVQYSSFVGAGTQENFPDLATGGLRSTTTPTTTVRAAISRILLYSGSLGFGTRVELSCGPSDDGCSKRLTTGRFFACGRGFSLPVILGRVQESLIFDKSFLALPTKSHMTKSHIWLWLETGIRWQYVRRKLGEQMGSKYARLRDNHPMRALAPISKLLGSLKPVNRGRLSKPTKLWSPSVFCFRTRLVQITAALPIHSATATRRENARTGGHIRWLPCRCAPSCTVFEVLVEVFGLFLVFQALLAEFARVRAHKQFAGSPGDSHNL